MTQMVAYQYGYGNFELDPDEITTLKQKIVELENHIGLRGAGGDIYNYLLGLISGSAVDPSVLGWISGAVGVNNGTSPAGIFIREYTAATDEIRLGTTPSESQLDEVSNNIALGLANGIVAHAGQLPSIEGIGAFDAGNAASGIFNDVYSPWAGTLLFAFESEPNFYEDWLLNADTVAGTIPDPFTAAPQSVTFKSVPGAYDLIETLEAYQETVLKDPFNALDAANTKGQTSNPSGLADTTKAFLYKYYGLTSSQFFNLGDGTPFGDKATVGAELLTSPKYFALKLTGDSVTIDSGLNYTGAVIEGAGGDDVFYVDSRSQYSSIIDGGKGSNIVNYDGDDGEKLQINLKYANSNFGYLFYVTSSSNSSDEYLYNIQNIVGNSAGDKLKVASQGLTFWESFGRKASVDLGDSSSNEIDLDGNASDAPNYFSIASGSTSTQLVVNAISNSAVNTPQDDGIAVADPGKVVVTAGTENDVLELIGSIANALGVQGEVDFNVGEKTDTIEYTGITAPVTVDVKGNNGTLVAKGDAGASDLNIDLGSGSETIDYADLTGLLTINVKAGTNNNTLTISGDSSLGSLNYDGGGGSNTINFSDLLNPILVTLADAATSAATFLVAGLNEVLSNVQYLIGTSADDTFDIGYTAPQLVFDWMPPVASSGRTDHLDGGVGDDLFINPDHVSPDGDAISITDADGDLTFEYTVNDFFPTIYAKIDFGQWNFESDGTPVGTSGAYINYYFSAEYLSSSHSIILNYQVVDLPSSNSYVVISNVAGNVDVTASADKLHITYTPFDPNPSIRGNEAVQDVDDTSTASPFANIQISDPNDDQTETVSIVLSDAANGILSNLGDGTYDADTGTYTIQGTPSAVSAAVSDLIFIPTANQVDVGQTVTTGFNATVTDSAGNSTTQLAATVVTTAVYKPQLFNMTSGQDTIEGGGGDDAVDAPFGTLGSGDVIDGGGGVNAINLQGTGAFDLRAPSSITDIQTVNVQEGQAAGGGVAATNQTVYLRSGSNFDVDVASGAADPANPNPEGTIIYGANNTDTINLGNGSDRVFLAGPGETIKGGDGTAIFFATASTMGVTIDGGTGKSIISASGGGDLTLGDNVTNITLLNLGALQIGQSAWKVIVNAIPDLTIDGSGSNDTITLGSASQTVQTNNGNVRVKATSAEAGAAVVGGHGSDVFELTTGGTATLNAKDYNVTVQLDEATDLVLGAQALKVSVSGSTDDDTIEIKASSLAGIKSIDGGGGTNTLELEGSGTFSLRNLSDLTNIQIVTAREGQAAGGGQTSTRQSLILRSGTNLAIDIASGTAQASDINPLGIAILGADNTDTVTLGNGTDNVTVGGAGESFIGGGGTDTFSVTSATIGATIDGGTGNSSLVVSGGGTAVMGSNITDIQSVFLTQSTDFTANGLNLTITGSTGADTIRAGSGTETIIGGGGADTLVAGTGTDIFKDRTAHLMLDTIQNFQAGDTIDLTNFVPSTATETTAHWSDGILSIAQGAKSALIKVAGNLTDAFTAKSDGHGGTDITYSPIDAQVASLIQNISNFGVDSSSTSVIASSFQVVPDGQDLVAVHH